jgi:Tfp pilus assembly protein PilX
MMRASRVQRRARAQRPAGFALVVALLLLTVAAAVGMVLMRKLQYQSAGQNMVIGGARARSAAATGIAWASHRIVRGGGSCVSGTLNLSESALRGFRVTIGCTRTVHGISLLARSSYALTALAQYGVYGQSDYAAFRQNSTLIQ